ncbi:MAG: division/cell wall cluster transcriptional repressor MraZ [Anaerolineae bacterium]|nr:division/cell wall cluster transcriptional repressor MraZ [Anaerolineae bacterium]
MEEPARSETRFSGEYEHSVDDKGRVTLPAKLREGLGDVVFLTRGLDGCLFVYSEPRWTAITENVGRLSLTRRTARVFARMVFAGTRCEVDRAGRILIPVGLRSFARIASQVVIVGVEDRVELWAPDRWEKAMSVLYEADDQLVSEEWEALDI